MIYAVNDMKILVIGAGGMLGYVTYQYLSSQNHQVIGITRTKKFPDMHCLDVTNKSMTDLFLAEHPCNAIINCAALLVKASEVHRSSAVALNTWFPHYLSEYCIQNGIYLVQVSTDGVFSGTKGGYDERSPSDTASFYGKSKFLGEVYDNALTVRSGLWGPDVNINGSGLFHWLMQQKNEVSGYSKALFNGVSNLEFAKFVSKAVQERWTGLFHLCAADPISKYDFLRRQNEVFCRQVAVHCNESVCVDRTLRNTRTDIPYAEKTFVQMMTELKVWLQGRGDFSYYFDGEG